MEIVTVQSFFLPGLCVQRHRIVFGSARFETLACVHPDLLYEHPD